MKQLLTKARAEFISRLATTHDGQVLVQLLDEMELEAVEEVLMSAPENLARNVGQLGGIRLIRDTISQASSVFERYKQ